MELNAEQKKIAFLEPKGHALLRGVAGSGKTSVGIHRTFFLLHHYCSEKDDAKVGLDAPGALHHIIVSGIERRKVFRDDADRENFRSDWAVSCRLKGK